MTPVFSARRRAEEFASLVERSSGTDLSDARYAEFLEIVASLRATPPAPARPEFVSALRERLMTAAATDLLPAQDARLTLPSRRPRDRRIAAAVGGFAIVGATTSMAMAAQSALPGDVLYPLKRAIENVQTGISVNEADKGSTMLANASGRLDEVSALSRGDSGDDSGTIAATLVSFAEQAASASDLLLADYESNGNESSIEELRDFTGESMDTLAELEDLVPEEARDELLHAARVLTRIDAEAQQACPVCGGDGITAIPRILAGSTTFAGGGVSASPTGVEPSPGAKDEGAPQASPQPSPGGSPSSGQGDSLPGGVLGSGQPGNEAPEGGGQADQPGGDQIGEVTEGLVDGGGQPTSIPNGLPGLPADAADAGLTGSGD